MRGIQNKKYVYIFNPWAIDSVAFQNESIGGMAFQEMKRYAPLNQEVAQRVNLNLYRCLEEFYDLENDPDALNNLIDHPAYQQEIEDMRKQMLKQMENTKDPLLKAFKGKDDTSVLRTCVKELQDYVIDRHKNNKRL